MRAFDHPREVNKQSASVVTSTVEVQEELLMDEPVPELPNQDTPLASIKGKETQKSFEVAAKALFDTKRPDKGKTKLSIGYTCFELTRDPLSASAYTRQSFAFIVKAAYRFPHTSSFHLESSEIGLDARRGYPPICPNEIFDV